MMKKIISLLVLIVIVFSLMGCDSGSKERAYGEKPEGFDEPMPEIWEEMLSGKEFDISSIDIKTAGEITIGADITDIDLNKFYWAKNLENVYVEEGNEKFVSDEGVLYSKSYETLYIWPRKKPVTTVRDTVKYFAPQCFWECDMPEDFEVPDGTITIGSGAFKETNLTKFHIKETIKTVGSWKYSKTTKKFSPNEIYPENCQIIEISAPIVYPVFYYKDWGKMGAETVIFKEGVREIRAMDIKQEGHWGEMIYTKNIIFPSTLTAIGDVYFPVNVNVTSYVLPESIVYFGGYAFDDYQAKIPFWAHLPFIIYDPKIIPRNATTKFDYKSEIAGEYIAYKLPKWEKTRENVIIKD